MDVAVRAAQVCRNAFNDDIHHDNVALIEAVLLSDYNRLLLGKIFVRLIGRGDEQASAPLRWQLRRPPAREK
jgi:hypothetical protein